MKSAGIILVVVGALWALIALNMDTTVETGGERIGSGAYPINVPKTRVHNIGLMDERRNHLIIASVVALAGIMLFGFGSISPAAPRVLPPTTTLGGGTMPCPYCAEPIKMEAKICRFCQREVRHVGLVESTRPENRVPADEALIGKQSTDLQQDAGGATDKTKWSVIVDNPMIHRGILEPILRKYQPTLTDAGIRYCFELDAMVLGSSLSHDEATDLQSQLSAVAVTARLAKTRVPAFLGGADA